jgi:CheY-like chemotaxis protein
LVSFAKVEQSPVEPVDVNALLGSVLKFRAPEDQAKGIEIRSQLAGSRAMVKASPGQLEQVLMNLLVDAEKAAAEAREKVITVSSSLLGGRVLVEIAHPSRAADSQMPENDHASPDALGLAVCRSVLESYGGEFRVAHLSPSQLRFEVELPMMETAPVALGSAPDVVEAGRPLTILLVEPDTKLQRQLVKLLGSRGDRVVPVSSAEEGADDAQRLRFDLVICEMRLPGLNWLEFFERVRHRIGRFVLLTDAFDPALTRGFKNGEGFVLNKPIDEAELLRICRGVEERVTVNH